ncbi:MAG: HAD family hydrolase [Chloroflexota bacterium]
MVDQAPERTGITAIVFDLDGTLYRQAPLRWSVLVRLLRAYATRPLSGVQTLRVLGAYRQAQEQLRRSPVGSVARADLAEEQLRITCDRTRAKPAFVAARVARWMEQEPLALLGRHIQPGLLAFLHAAKARGLLLGVLSDYPAQAKLEALGLHTLFDVILAAQSPEVGVFKPHPRGLLRTAERLGVNPRQCVYIGDRAEVDAPAALAAGMACCIVTADSPAGPRTWTQVAGFPELRELLFRTSAGQVPLIALNQVSTLPERSVACATDNI